MKLLSSVQAGLKYPLPLCLVISQSVYITYILCRQSLRSIFIPRNFTQKLFYRPRNFESFFFRRMTSKRDDYLSFNDVLGHNTKGNAYN